MRVESLLGSVIVLSLLSQSAYGQTLTQVAQDERERREANAGRGSASFTNIGVRVHRHPIGVTCYCTRTVTAVSPEPFKKDPYWARIKDEERVRKLVWQRTRSHFLATYRSQQRRLDKLLVLERSCNSGGISVYWTEPWGTQWATPSWGLGVSMCEAVPEEIENTRRAIRQTQANAHNEARKLRIDPGLARLH